MAENDAAVNNNMNEPQPQDNQQPAAEPQPAAPANEGSGQTILGGEQKQAEPAGAPEAYDFKESIPEGVEMDEAITKDFTEIARSMNLTNAQANQLAAYGIKYGQTVAAAAQQQRVAEVEQWGKDAKESLGADFDKVMVTAAAGIEAVEKTVPNIRQALNETGAGNRIEIIRMCEILGQLVKSDPGQLINAGGAPQPASNETWYKNSKM